MSAADDVKARAVEVLAAHGWEHIAATVDGVWCATCDVVIGYTIVGDAIPDAVVYAHQAGLLADPDALASAKAGALREAADDVREYMALAWGSDRPWFTTGTKVANLVSDVLRDRADQIDPTEGTRG